MSELGDGPIEAEYQEKMNALARVIDEFFNGEAASTAGSTRPAPSPRPRLRSMTAQRKSDERQDQS
jgi:hypothetical protein